MAGGAPSASGDPRVVIIGAGPTGLGAGHRLAERGHPEWSILEASDRVGGLATSFTDEAGFTYDVGAHVLFSHYDYYDALVDRLMGSQHRTLKREAWVWMENRFIPYPFQLNLKGLEPQTITTVEWSPRRSRRGTWRRHAASTVWGTPRASSARVSWAVWFCMPPKASKAAARPLTTGVCGIAGLHRGARHDRLVGRRGGRRRHPVRPPDF